MFIVKLLIGLISVYVCTKIAKSKAVCLKEVTLFWQSLVDLCKIIEIDLSYKKSPINEIFLKDFCSCDFNKFIKIYVKTNEFCFPNYVLDEEKPLIKSFILSLGKSDSASQRLFAESKEVLFKELRDKKAVAENKFYSVILKVGFSVGVMLFIMVI